MCVCVCVCVCVQDVDGESGRALLDELMPPSLQQAARSVWVTEAKRDVTVSHFQEQVIKVSQNTTQTRAHTHTHTHTQWRLRAGAPGAASRQSGLIGGQAAASQILLRTCATLLRQTCMHALAR